MRSRVPEILLRTSVSIWKSLKFRNQYFLKIISNWNGYWLITFISDYHDGCLYWNICENDYRNRPKFSYTWHKKFLVVVFKLVTLPVRWDPGDCFKNTYELLNLGALKISYGQKTDIFQCMGKIFWVEFQRGPLKFHTKYLTHTLKDTFFMQI